MKLSVHTLFTLLLLTVGLGCKREPDEEPIPNLATCRISKQTYKTVWLQGPKQGTETIQVDNKPVEVAITNEALFNYDNEGRIIAQTTKVPIGNQGQELYAYYPTYIVRRWIASKIATGEITDQSQDTIFLNKQGLAILSKSNHWPTTYDQQGYLIKESYKTTAGLPSGDLIQYTIQNGNIVTSESIAPGSDIEHKTNQSEFLLDKKNLPNPLPFYGKKSTNLISRYTETILSSTIYPLGQVYQTTYQYTFDQYGRVKRRIAIGKRLKAGWLFDYDPYGVGVIDYEYACP